jgi:hypothetical protein
MNTDDLKVLAKNEIPKLAKNLNAGEIRFLVQTLSEKDDTARYNAFLLLQSNSTAFPFVYEYWSDLEKKMESPNSYQRSLGLMLIAENVRWDRNGTFSSLSKFVSYSLHFALLQFTAFSARRGTGRFGVDDFLVCDTTSVRNLQNGRRANCMNRFC